MREILENLMAWTLEIDDLRNSSNVRERKIQKIVRILKKLNVMNVLRSRFVKRGPFPINKSRDPGIPSDARIAAGFHHFLPSTAVL